MDSATPNAASAGATIRIELSASRTVDRGTGRRFITMV
jgi:hypothetical protein